MLKFEVCVASAIFVVLVSLSLAKNKSAHQTNEMYLQLNKTYAVTEYPTRIIVHGSPTIGF